MPNDHFAMLSLLMGTLFQLMQLQNTQILFFENLSHT